MPKTFKQLYPRICDFDNLYGAHRKARRGGKRKHPAVAEFEIGLGSNLLELRDELLSEDYVPGAYRTFIVRERKERTISAAPYRDRVVHHALINIIQPIFEARFIHDSYACRKDKGTHRAIHRAQAFARRYPYVLQADIREFFPSIDHAILKGQIERHVACLATLRLVDKVLVSGAGILARRYTPMLFPGDDLLALARPRGLPIGNLTSQHWANVYLHDLDMFVKHTLKCEAYVRYSDDFVLFSDSRSALHEWHHAITDHLVTLRLTLHGPRTQVYPVKSGIGFLGWRIFPHHLRLRRDNLRHALRRLRRQQEALASGALQSSDLTRSVQAWIAHAQHGQTYRLRRRVMRQFVFSARAP